MKQIATKVSFSLSIIFIMLFGISHLGYGQSVWIEEPDNITTIGIDAMIPSFDDILPTDNSPQTALYLYSYIPVSNKLTLQLNLPISRYYNGGGESDIALGNPYIGLRTKANNPNLKFDLGVRLPLASETSGALLTGLLVEDYQVGAFIPNAVSIVSNLHYRHANQSGLIFKVGGGPEALFPTESGLDGELYIKYYGQLLYGINNITFGGGLTGVLLVTENDLSFSDRTLHDVGLTGSYKFDHVTAGAYIRTSLDDDRNDLIHAIVGLNLAFHF